MSEKSAGMGHGPVGVLVDDHNQDEGCLDVLRAALAQAEQP